jgi:hypothetical protein
MAQTELFLGDALRDVEPHELDRARWFQDALHEAARWRRRQRWRGWETWEGAAWWTITMRRQVLVEEVAEHREIGGARRRERGERGRARMAERGADRAHLLAQFADHVRNVERVRGGVEDARIMGRERVHGR